MGGGDAPPVEVVIAEEPHGRGPAANCWRPTMPRHLNWSSTSPGRATSHDFDVIRLRNCPFHPLAQQHPELVCGRGCASAHPLFTCNGTELHREAALLPGDRDGDGEHRERQLAPAHGGANGHA